MSLYNTNVENETKFKRLCATKEKKTKPFLKSGVWRINGESHSQRWYGSRVIRLWLVSVSFIIILITTTTNPITTYYQH